MPERPDRQSHRLKGFDYTEPRSYFVTICTDGRACVFGSVIDGQMVSNTLGVLVERELLLIERRRRPWISVDHHVVMPNHVHAIIQNQRGDVEVHRKVKDASAGDASVARTLAPLSLGAIVGGFKSGVTREARRLGLWGQGKLWQREFYDHVIRSPKSYQNIERYITNNPRVWASDRENPEQVGEDDFAKWLKDEGGKPM